jgi:hypothetical protein
LTEVTGVVTVVVMAAVTAVEMAEEGISERIEKLAMA